MGGISSLYLLKALFALIVVGIHTPPLEYVIDTALMSSIALVAVPVFFAITGYFLYTEKEEQWINRSQKMLIKVAKVWFVTNMMYFAYHTLLGKQLYQSWGDILNLFTFGMTNEGYLWYLLALFYTLIILHVLFRCGLGQIVSFLPLLLFPTILLGRYAFILGADGTILLDFNVLMTGLPYVSLGFCIHKYQERLLRYNWELISLLILALGVIEIAVLVGMPGMDSRNYFGRCFFTMPLTLSLLCFALQHRSLGAGSWCERVGKDYAGNIYYLHYFSIYIIRFLVDRLGCSYLYYQEVGFISVFLLSLGLAYLAIKIQDRFGWSVLR